MKVLLKVFGTIVCGVTFIAGALGLISIFVAGWNKIGNEMQEKGVEYFK